MIILYIKEKTFLLYLFTGFQHIKDCFKVNDKQKIKIL